MHRLTATLVAALAAVTAQSVTAQSVTAQSVTAQSATAQTLEQLRLENQSLRAELARMRRQVFVPTSTAADDHDHADHDHHHPGDHDHTGHDHDHGIDPHHDPYWSDQACEPHFDYILPFPDHHGGHGHCDLCRCRSHGGHCGHAGDGHAGDGHAGHGNAGHGNAGHGNAGHGHGHQHGPAYHHSIDGYPILHGARTEFFFVERHLHLRLADARGADGGEVDELEFEAELVYALNDRVVLIATMPLIHLNPADESSTTGIGDLEFGVRVMAYNGERDGWLFGLDVQTPTGDPDRDLGGETRLIPSANWVHDFGCGTYMFNVAAWEMPIDEDGPEDVFRHDFVLLHTFLHTADAACFRYLTPSLEINTEAVINGPNSGHAVVDATVGLTWLWGDENEISAGWSFPISGDRNFDNLFLLNFIRHL